MLAGAIFTAVNRRLCTAPQVDAKATVNLILALEALAHSALFSSTTAKQASLRHPACHCAGSLCPPRIRAGAVRITARWEHSPSVSRPVHIPGNGGSHYGKTGFVSIFSARKVPTAAFCVPELI
ncbi:hypothetical protein ATPR_0074 [Acetobacter tropicalis NBRC 101654]|uniref:Uncharacterized protein n=1 Tax=Acetobacter tropicalis NBRC 101654 TaxID=749388 RepID=F7V9M4_9PROT|nr:hypothetical protein ATPR_0074 [Acetobacter tropicalis NBRC 101654]